ncbi:hypothetical protein DSECCO2_159930 [anaerobic digester metagenome]
MKARLILIAALVFVSVTAFAQGVFTVTRVSGKITNLRTGAEVVAGDILQPDDQLAFETFDTYAIAIGESMGRFKIKLLDPPAPEPTSILTGRVSEIAMPTKSRSLMLARFNPQEKEVADLRTYFGTDKFSVIGETVEIALNAQKYPLTADQFIVFYYRFDNKPVSKKLGFENQVIKINKDQIVSNSYGTVSGSEIPNLSVYKYEATTRNSEEVTRFTLVFVNEADLKSEFGTIIPILKRQKMGDDEIKKYLIEYYYDFYGATDSKTIDRFAEDVVKNFDM